MSIMVDTKRRRGESKKGEVKLYSSLWMFVAHTRSSNGHHNASSFQEDALHIQIHIHVWEKKREKRRETKSVFRTQTKVKSLVCLNQCARKRPSYLCPVITEDVLLTFVLCAHLSGSPTDNIPPLLSYSFPLWFYFWPINVDQFHSYKKFQ